MESSLKTLFKVAFLALLLLFLAEACTAADLTVKWTVTADDGEDCLTGPPQGHYLVWSLDSAAVVAADTSSGWIPGPDVTIITDITSEACGTTQYYTLSDLPGNATVYVSIKPYDDAGNVAAMGNVAVLQTDDEIPPAPVWDARNYE